MKLSTIFLLCLFGATSWSTSFSNVDKPEVEKNSVIVEKNTQNKSSPRLVPDNATSRGELLYNNHCTECHTSMAHIRKNHRARSRPQIMQWVSKWASHKKLEWTSEELESVTDYLNIRYYKH